MDRAALLTTLRRAGVPDGHYFIEGVHQPAPTPPDFAFLRRSAGGGWETGVYERGRYEVVGRHPDEAAACAHLLRLLT
ncbi:hypothetical protein [Streptomyces sp. NPDC058045]|uniref:hypothetical protein n=1 Tax=Streptomyces sp. NPDC058045 TaxID=3346311 RepID=UPI0036E3E05C